MLTWWTTPARGGERPAVRYPPRLAATVPLPDALSGCARQQ